MACDLTLLATLYCMDRLRAEPRTSEWHHPGSDRLFQPEALATVALRPRSNPVSAAAGALPLLVNEERLLTAVLVYLRR